jgi:hypothetical protein
MSLETNLPRDTSYIRCRLLLSLSAVPLYALPRSSDTSFALPPLFSHCSLRRPNASPRPCVGFRPPGPPDLDLFRKCLELALAEVTIAAKGSQQSGRNWRCDIAGSFGTAGGSQPVGMTRHPEYANQKRIAAAAISPFPIHRHTPTNQIPFANAPINVSPSAEKLWARTIRIPWFTLLRGGD